MASLRSPRRHVTLPCQPHEKQGLMALPLPVSFLQMPGPFHGLSLPLRSKGAPDLEPRAQNLVG